MAQRENTKVVLLSAYACDPLKGSEAGNGWNWAIHLANLGLEVHLCTQAINKNAIEGKQRPSTLTVHYVAMPIGLDKLYRLGNAGMYLHYIVWQYFLSQRAINLHKRIKFDLAHHVTWGSLQLGTFLYRLGVPFIFGPVGGGQEAPEIFREYFGRYWDSEQKRKKISALLIRFSPATVKAIRNAKVLVASNKETESLANRLSATNVANSLDVAVQDDFMSSGFSPRHPKDGRLRLLWVGRFMPRKGLPLVLEVMSRLKANKSITLTIVGDGEMRGYVQDFIANNKLAETVNMVGKVPFSEVRRFYESHDVFFYTSFRDSGSSQIVEAMACGLPVVTLKLHGQDMLVSEDTGIKCQCTDIESIISCLMQSLEALSRDPHRVAALSQSAYQFAQKNTWRNKVNNFVSDFYG